MPLVDGAAPPVEPLTDGQWQLVYPGVDTRFGDNTTYILVAPPGIEPADPATQDTAHAVGDGTVFGRDARPGQTITFELGVHEWSEETGTDAHARLQAAWRGDPIRDTPGAVAELHVRRASRERLVYGRPRRFASTFAQIPSLGYSGITCDFVCADDLWYDAAATTLVLSLVPPPSGGLLPPLIPPLRTTAATTRPGLAHIGGLVNTWPVITIAGPVAAPTVTVTGVWSLALDTTLGWDQTVTIDTRPWARTVTRNDGANLAGKLTRSSVRLSRAWLPADTVTEVIFGGVDPTGTSRLTVSWRNAYPHL